jgi:hypothetical protein
MAKLYEPCPHHGLIPGGRCRLCDDVGFVPVGVTTGQVERWATWERWLNGDPGLPREEREAAAEYVLGRLKARGLI